MRERAAEGSAAEATEAPAREAPLARGAPLTPAGLLGLQRSAGNRVTMALLARAQALRKLGGRTEDAIAAYEQYLGTGDAARVEDAELMLELLRTHGAGPY